MAERDEFSLEKLVGEKTCPAFIWHTFEDRTVPVQNSLLLAQAMKEAGVSFELHIFPTGGHGLSLANEETATKGGGSINPHAEIWIELAIRWIKHF